MLHAPRVIEYVAGFTSAPPPWPEVCPAEKLGAENGDKAGPAETEGCVLSLLTDPEMAKVIEEMRAMKLSAQLKISVIEGEPVLFDDDEVDWLVASKLCEAEAKSVEHKLGSSNLTQFKQNLLKNFGRL